VRVPELRKRQSVTPNSIRSLLQAERKMLKSRLSGSALQNPAIGAESPKGVWRSFRHEVVPFAKRSLWDGKGIWRSHHFSEMSFGGDLRDMPLALRTKSGRSR
jgi:hypothetical protein